MWFIVFKLFSVLTVSKTFNHASVIYRDNVILSLFEIFCELFSVVNDTLSYCMPMQFKELAPFLIRHQVGLVVSMSAFHAGLCPGRSYQRPS